jgi:hypothetical protein
MDLTYTHGSQIQVIRACYDDESEEPLVAIGGEHSVDVLSIVSCGPIAYYPSRSSLTIQA